MLVHRESPETYIQERPSDDFGNSDLEIGIRTDDRAVLATKFHQTRLEVLAAGTGDASTDGGAAGEVDLAHGWMLNHGIHNGRGIARGTGQAVETASGETGILEGLADGPVATR